MYKIEKIAKDNPRLKIGKNIKRHRGKMSQGILSQKATLSVPQIVKMETNPNSNPTIEALFRVASALGKQVEDLLR